MSQPDVARLEAERHEIAQEIQTLITTLKGAALAGVADHLTTLGDRRNAIEGRLKAACSKREADLRPVQQVVEEAMQVIAEESRRLLTLPIEPLRDLVNRLILDATVDMETKTVSLTLALPTWAVQSRAAKPAKHGKSANNSENPLCPNIHLRSPSGGWTQMQFAVFACGYQHLRGSTTKPPCYSCKRQVA